MEKKVLDVKPSQGLDIQLGLLCAMLDDGTREWRSELDEITQEAILWQPFPKSHSIGSVILHIADVEAYWIQEVGAQQALSDEQLKLFMTLEIKQDAVEWPIPPNEPIEWYWEVCANVRKKTHEIIQEIGNPASTRPSGDGKREYTLRWLLHHVITHEAYHGGQVSLLNLMFQNMRS